MMLKTALFAASLLAGAASQQPIDATACKACHGDFGISRNPAFPNLAGQKAAYLELQLKAFRAKERKNEFMNVVAAQLSDDDIHQLALYWSSRPATPDDVGAQGAGPAIPSRMTMPANFPSGFAMYAEEAEGGIIVRRYANAPAWTAARTRKPLPDGSVLIFATYKERTAADGRTGEGELQGYSGMEQRAGWGATVPAILRNGDWDYALFRPDRTRRDELNQAPCLACHKPIAASSHVFTLKALTAAAAERPLKD